MTEKQRIIDFIEGRANGRRFIEELCSDSDMLNWIQTNIPLKRCSQKKASYINMNTGFECVDSVPFDIRIEIESKNGIDKAYSLGEIIDIQHLLYCCFAENFPKEKITLNTSLEEKFDFILSNTPIYIGGNGVDVILEEIYDSTASCKTGTERIRNFRRICKERFHIVGRRYPRWMQCAQWPLSSDGEPMLFLRQKEERDGSTEFVNYYFFDHINNIEVIINQTI